MDELVTDGDLMKRGIALLEENTETTLAEAVGLFDRAIAIRRATMEPGDHWKGYLLAASWMNRGDALTRLAQPEQLSEAVRSYEEALAVMRDVPLDANPLYRRRLAIAWMNRGITLHQVGAAASFARAAQSFDHAIDVTRGHPEHALILACSWMNRGNALLRVEPPQATEARASAVSALDLLAGAEQQDLTAAEAALKARHVICQAVAELLAGETFSDCALELVSGATDAVEEGMRLIRHWEEQGETRFRPVLGDFFRFGAAIYQKHQPQFLAEFVLENLHPGRPHAAFSQDIEMHALAARALAVAGPALNADGFASVNAPRFERFLETLRAQQFVERNLTALRRRLE